MMQWHSETLVQHSITTQWKKGSFSSSVQTFDNPRGTDPIAPMNLIHRENQSLSGCTLKQPPIACAIWADILDFIAN